MSILDKDSVALQGEIVALRDKLDSNSAADRKAAARRVMSLVRSGEDVGAVFSSMLRCVKTDDLELKRFVYLYLVTYSSQQSEQSIMAVNTFIQDSQDPNPLVRALAIRTMSRIRIDSVAENLVGPLRQHLSDDSPFVRKTAAFSISKLYDIIPETMENSGLFSGLLRLLDDDNPLVVSNATAAICAINVKRHEPIFEFTPQDIAPILNALPNSSEWCQIMLLDALAQYPPTDDSLVDRLIPFLRHSNAAVVLGAFKCIVKFLGAREAFAQILPPFLTLVSNAKTEIQYIALRTLALFTQKFPRALIKDVRIFFCKYNDPSYIKAEKLVIIAANCSPANAGLILDELLEYCNSVDLDFVRRSVQSVGEIALKIENCSQKCVEILVGLIDGKAGYAVEQAVIALSDVLRRFPGRFESVIARTCQSLDRLRDTNARAAGVWILGEYSRLIEGVDVVLDPFLDGFGDEPLLVQLQLISAIVKAYLNKPEETRDQLQFVLNEATKVTMHPDVRNRATIYWRMLSMGADATRQFIQFEKTGVEIPSGRFTAEVLNDLIVNIGLAAGVLHILPSQFVCKRPNEETARPWRSLRMRAPCAVAVSSDWSARQVRFQILNKADHNLSAFALAVHKNGCGFTIDPNPAFPGSLEPGATCEVGVAFVFKREAAVAGKNAFNLEFALRTSDGPQHFYDSIDIRTIFDLSRLIPDTYLSFCAKHQQSIEFNLESGTVANEHELKRRKLTVLAHGGRAIAVGFVVAGQDMVCAIENRHGRLQCLARGDPAFFQLVKDSAKYTFCND
jgi:vesicle coat complex subunit